MKQIRIGDITIDAVIEREGPWRRPQDFFPTYDDAVFKHHLKTMEPEVFDAARGMMVITYQTFVVRTPRYTILVDTCTGEDKGHPPPFDFPGKERWRNELFALGISYEQIDYVFCTHLHIDHTGWNTTLRDGRWVPTFPNARYVFDKTEFDYWTETNAKAEVPPFVDSVLPVVEAKRAELVGNDFAIGDHMRILPTPGHTPGHLAFTFGRGKDDAVFAGDLMHSPIQTLYPELSPKFDVDPAQAAKTRRSFLERYCDTDTLCCPAHFPSPSVGKIRRKGNGFVCETA